MFFENNFALLMGWPYVCYSNAHFFFSFFFPVIYLSSIRHQLIATVLKMRLNDGWDTEYLTGLWILLQLALTQELETEFSGKSSCISTNWYKYCENTDKSFFSSSVIKEERSCRIGHLYRFWGLCRYLTEGERRISWQRGQHTKGWECEHASRSRNSKSLHTAEVRWSSQPPRWTSFTNHAKRFWVK